MSMGSGGSAFRRAGGSPQDRTGVPEQHCKLDTVSSGFRAEREVCWKVSSDPRVSRAILKVETVCSRKGPLRSGGRQELGQSLNVCGKHLTVPVCFVLSSETPSRYGRRRRIVHGDVRFAVTILHVDARVIASRSPPYRRALARIPNGRAARHDVTHTRRHDASTRTGVSQRTAKGSGPRRRSDRDQTSSRRWATIQISAEVAP